jgi:hypothetical protein
MNLAPLVGGLRRLLEKLSSIKEDQLTDGHGVASQFNNGSALVTPTKSSPFPVTTSTGTPSYHSVTAGTITVPVGARVDLITCYSATGGSVTIDGGASITIPALGEWTDDTTKYVGAIDIVFTGTDTAYVSWSV